MLVNATRNLWHKIAAEIIAASKEEGAAVKKKNGYAPYG